jgi:hypothetical protein
LGNGKDEKLIQNFNRRPRPRLGVMLLIYLIIDASKQVGLEVNTEKANYILMSRHRNGEQNHNMKKGNDPPKMCQH